MEIFGWNSLNKSVGDTLAGIIGASLKEKLPDQIRQKMQNQGGINGKYLISWPLMHIYLNFLYYYFFTFYPFFDLAGLEVEIFSRSVADQSEFLLGVLKQLGVGQGQLRDKETIPISE